MSHLEQVNVLEVQVLQGESLEKNVYLASVSGFCQGVEAALQKFHEALHRYGAPIYVLYELVHNVHVTQEMSAMGAVFVHDLSEVPAGSVLLLGAHGVPREVEERALSGGFRAVIDSTCPFVRALHVRASRVGVDEDLLLYGKTGHPEAVGILGHARTSRCHVLSSLADVERLGPLHHPLLLIQTTMSHVESGRVVCRLRERYPELRCPSGDVCHASQERQAALESLCACCEGILVVGSTHSANANRLVEVAVSHGCRSWLIEDSESIPEESLSLCHLGLIGGASVPRSLLGGVRDALVSRGYSVCQQ